MPQKTMFSQSPKMPTVLGSSAGSTTLVTFSPLPAVETIQPTDEATADAAPNVAPSPATTTNDVSPFASNWTGSLLFVLLLHLVCGCGYTLSLVWQNNLMLRTSFSEEGDDVSSLEGAD